MEGPPTVDVRSVHEDTEELGAYVPVPGFGILPANAFIIHAEQSVLVDTGVIVLREAFMPALRSAIDPADIRWLWLTHTAPESTGFMDTKTRAFFCVDCSAR